ncbi:PREDICTED: melanoma-associated antigen 11-like [Dipodomys ordii]|uniref:Melanoma-associated antigen 11-like n=1 Tax=Dipodomys ordii TaxID=10020 RepID=A0A1S3G0K0_DIPOR|nr:PREDICTED: melanoma-associated antigen 11-like [Dipodomys ordii]
MPYTFPSEFERGSQAQREATGLVHEQVPQAEEAFTCLMPPTLREVLEDLLDEAVREINEEDQESSDQARDLYLHDDKTVHMALRKEAISLVPYLLYKYWSSRPVTEMEMLNRITGGYQHYFSVILDKACVCMQLLFGIELKEVDPIVHTHVLVIAAGITYNGILSHVLGMPKTGLLIIILCIIFTEGNYATEDVIWKVLSRMEVYPDREHFLYGNPRKLLMEDFVWEQYLVYQQVPGSDPTVFMFRWGPRAYAETTKMKVLEHWAKFSRIDPRSFASLYDEALREEDGENTHDDTL